MKRNHGWLSSGLAEGVVGALTPASSQHSQLRPASNSVRGITAANTGTNREVPKWDYCLLLQRGAPGSRQPTESEKLSLPGEIFTSAEGWQGSSRQKGGLRGGLSEGSSPELLRTSQVRESWDPQLCTADCWPAVTPGSHRVLRALCVIALRTAINLQFLAVASVRDKISAL